MRHFRLPDEIKSRKSVTLSLRVNPEIKQELSVLARQPRITISELVNAVLEDYVQFLHSASDRSDKNGHKNT